MEVVCDLFVVPSLRSDSDCAFCDFDLLILRDKRESLDGMTLNSLPSVLILLASHCATDAVVLVGVIVNLHT